MTPKEKARELVKLFKPYSIDDYAAFTNAYRCVDEIIKANPMEIEYIAEEKEFDLVSCIDYWQRVKQELQKL